MRHKADDIDAIFARVTADWARVGTYEIVKGVVAIGGKTIRGARQAGSHETVLQVISAYAHEAGSVIDQRCVDGKSNEIGVIGIWFLHPKLRPKCVRLPNLI